MSALGPTKNDFSRLVELSLHSANVNAETFLSRWIIGVINRDSSIYRSFEQILLHSPLPRSSELGIVLRQPIHRRRIFQSPTWSHYWTQTAGISLLKIFPPSARSARYGYRGVTWQRLMQCPRLPGALLMHPKPSGTVLPIGARDHLMK